MYSVPLIPVLMSGSNSTLGFLDVVRVLYTMHECCPSQVRGYPTIKFFPAGKKDGSAEDYDGGRTGSDIVNWALEKFAENIPPPEVLEVGHVSPKPNKNAQPPDRTT